MKILLRYTFIAALFASTSLSAQDIHFSMFYASPLTLNPAMTGAIDGEGSYRVSAIYRNQWRSISTPFQTGAASFDIKLLQDKLKYDIFGVGGTFVGDKSGDARLSSNSGQLSVAYHKGLDKEHKHFLGLGFQFSYTQQSLQLQNLTFPDQFQLDPNHGYVPTLQSGESIKPNLNLFDMNVGLLHQSTINDWLGIMDGFSMYHLVEPKESFLGQDVRLADRFVGHLGLRFKVLPKFYIAPNFIYMYQNKAQEFDMGSAFEYHLGAGKSELITSIGGWYRWGDAAIISAGLEYYKVKLMFSYDINASKLRAATNDRGAFELALIYTGIIKAKSLNYPILVPCPMM